MVVTQTFTPITLGDRPAFYQRHPDGSPAPNFHDHFVFSLVAHGPAGALSRFGREKPVKSRDPGSLGAGRGGPAVTQRDRPECLRGNRESARRAMTGFGL